MNSEYLWNAIQDTKRAMEWHAYKGTLDATVYAALTKKLTELKNEWYRRIA